jgi:multisubunit Na+/H+ antiporter MnhB subunit
MNKYPVNFDIDFLEEHDRLSSFFRPLLAIPVLVILCVLASVNGVGLAGGLIIATALMIIFRQRYPRWWFDFVLELNRFSSRVFAYLLLLSDQYPSTVDKQSVRLDVEYPDAKKGLNRWLPIVKWLLAIPHYVVLAFLIIGAIVATIIAWFAILFTGQYPRSLFDYVVGVGRWATRVNAYAFLLTTDVYPPFSLK